MSLARKLRPDDYPLIHAALNDLCQRLKANPSKAMYRFLDAEVAIRSVFAFDHAYIVAETYLVVFDLSTPWYSLELFLHELLVLRLTGGAGFGVVPEFLSKSASEAGAKLAAAGTALAKSDAALASLYQRYGFVEAARTLVKET